MKISHQRINFKSLPQKARTLSSRLVAGARPCFNDIKLLKAEGITQIIDLRHKFSYFTSLRERLFCFLLGVKYLKRPMTIHKKLPEKKFFENIADIIYSNKGKTYVHCVGGLHRTNLVSYATLMLKENQKAENLIAFLKKYNFFHVFKFKNAQRKKMHVEARLKEFIQMFCK